MQEDSMRQQKRISCLGLMALGVWLMPASSFAGASPQQTGAGEKNQPLSAGPLWTPAPYTPGSIGGILNALDAVGMFSTMISTRFGQNVAPTSTDAAKQMQGSFWLWQGDTLQRHAYGIRRGKTSLMIIDGKEGPGFEDVGAPAVSPDGQRVAYAAKLDKEWRGGSDRGEGPRFHEIGTPAFSPDGLRLSHSAKSRKNL